TPQVKERASRGASLSADGRFALAWHPDKKHVLLYDVAGHKLIHRFEQPAPVHHAFFSPDGQRVVACYDNQSFAALWQGAAGNFIAFWETPSVSRRSDSPRIENVVFPAEGMDRSGCGGCRIETCDRHIG